MAHYLGNIGKTDLMGKEFAIVEHTFLSKTMAEWNNCMLLTADNTLHVAILFFFY